MPPVITVVSKVDHWRRDYFRVQMERILHPLQHGFFDDLYNYLFRGRVPDRLVYNFLRDNLDVFKEYAPHDYDRELKWPYIVIIDHWAELHAALPHYCQGSDDNICSWTDLDPDQRIAHLIAAKLTFTEDELLVRLLKTS